MRAKHELIGTWSEATLRPRDLLAAFADALEFADEDGEYIGLVERARSRAAVYAKLDISGYEDNRADHILEDLGNAIDACTPEGISWGAHEGDGACFGFWEMDPEDQDDFLDHDTALAVEGED